MIARLATGMRVAALRRRVEAAGGFATVLARGDEQAGAVLVLAHHNRHDAAMLERVFGHDDRYRMIRVGPESPDDLATLEAYGARRRRNDADLWLIEVDVADAERFAAETIADD